MLQPIRLVRCEVLDISMLTSLYIFSNFRRELRRTLPEIEVPQDTVKSAKGIIVISYGSLPWADEGVILFSET